MSSIQGISFYSQDQAYWSQSQAQSAASAAQASQINVIGAAMLAESKGESGIANGTALKRVNSQLSAAVESALQLVGVTTPLSSTGTSGSSGTSSSSTGSSSSTTPKAAPNTPAVATGSAPLTTGTSLSTLGILAGGTIAVITGATTTSYKSTGTDTVGDLINALNVNLPTNAQVIASLNSKGQLVITARNNTADITISGSGTDTAAIGFANGHTTFTPTKPKTTSAAADLASPIPSSSSTSSSSSSSSANSTSSKTAKKSQPTNDSSVNEQTFKSAASLLSASGVSGNLVNMLA
jgi:hypothetical protein